MEGEFFFPKPLKANRRKEVPANNGNWDKPCTNIRLAA
jgi:hypothetical protein